MEEKRKLIEDLYRDSRISEDEYAVLTMDDVFIPTYEDGQYNYQLNLEKLEEKNVA